MPALLIPILDEIFATRDQAEWRRILDEAGLIFGIVADMDEIHEDEQILASEALVPFTDGSSLTVNSPLWIAGQEKLPPRPAPTSASTARKSCAKPAIPRPRSAPCGRPAHRLRQKTPVPRTRPAPGHVSSAARIFSPARLTI